MKIKKTFVEFTGSVDVGRYGLFVDVDNDGVNIDINELTEQAIHFPRVIFIGKPLEQKTDIANIVRKIIRKNTDTKIEIHTDGTIRPVGITNFDNVAFIVSLKLKSSGIDFQDRLKETTLNWFNEVLANFKFYVENEDDVDEVNMIVSNFGIKRKQVFLAIKGEATKEQLDFIIKHAKNNSYNFTLDFDKLFWR